MPDLSFSNVSTRPRKSSRRRDRVIAIPSKSTWGTRRARIWDTWRKSRSMLTQDCRLPITVGGKASQGRSCFSIRWLLSQRASGVSVVWLSISPGKSTEMENEIASARLLARSLPRSPSPAHRRRQGNAWSINPIGVAFILPCPRPGTGLSASRPPSCVSIMGA